MPSTRHALVTVFGALFIIGATAYGTGQLIAPSTPPAAVPIPAAFSVSPVTGEPLSSTVWFIIVDGLRHDFGTDPESMPLHSRRFASSTHAEIWASPVSMTSSAVLTYGAGQRGDIDQIVNKETDTKTEYHDLLQSIRESGLTAAVTGDHTWSQRYDGSMHRSHPDPEGVALEVDYNDETFAAAREFLKAEPHPNLVVAHFVTPDHQAHAYGIVGDRDRAHMRDFDVKLDSLLRALPADATVFVTSDHGATDHGTHGTDSPIQRRSPIFAYGKGIVGGERALADARILDQTVLPSTFAALLGIPAPAASRGHLLADWLDTTPEHRAQLACQDLDRLRVYAEAETSPSAVAELGVAGACASGDAAARIVAAEKAARDLDALISRSGVKGSPWGVLVPAGTLLLCLLLGLWTARELWGHGLRQLWPVGLAFAALLSVTLALLLHLERLPGNWHVRLYVTIMGLGFALLLVGLWRYRQTAALLDRRPEWLALVMPGLLVLTYTRTAQPVSYIVFAILLVATLVAGVPRTEGGLPTPPGRWRLLAKPWEAILAVVLVAALWRVGFKGQDYLYGTLETQPTALFVVALVSIGAYAIFAWYTAPTGTSSSLTIVLGVVAGLSLWARRAAPPWLCVTLWPLLFVLGAVLALRRHRHHAELAFIGSYAFVSRDAELPLLLATLAVAHLVGRVLARYDAFTSTAQTRGCGGRPPPATASSSPLARPSAVLWVITLILSWSFTQRVAVQLGLDFTYLDWGAAAFREPDAPLWRIGVGIAAKHLLARGLLVYAILAALPAPVRPMVGLGHLLTQLFRLATLCFMLYFARDSFWTALRVMGDLPHAFVGVFVGAVAFAFTGLSRKAAKNPEAAPS